MVSVASLSDWLLVLVVVISFSAEKHYVGRASIVANTVSIFGATAHHWDSIPWPFQVYASIGLFFCAIAFLSYLLEAKAPSDFYFYAWLLYNSVVATIYVVVAGFLS